MHILGQHLQLAYRPHFQASNSNMNHFMLPNPRYNTYPFFIMPFWSISDLILYISPYCFNRGQPFKCSPPPGPVTARFTSPDNELQLLLLLLVHRQRAKSSIGWKPWILRGPHHRGRVSMLTLFSYYLYWAFENEQGTYGTSGYAFTIAFPDQNYLYPGEKQTLAFYSGQRQGYTCCVR